MKVYASGEGKIEISFDAGATYLELKDVTEVGFKADNNRSEWNPFSTDGWTRNYVTTKSLSMSISKKHILGNDADDKLVDMLVTQSAYSQNGIKFKFTFPKTADAIATAATLEFDASIKFDSAFTAAAEEMATLDFEAMVDGKPTYTKEVA